MIVQLNYTHRAKPPWSKYLFSVLINSDYSRERVYQLEVVQVLHEPKDRHSESHEHIGDRRSIGDARWKQWGYDEVLAYFCAQTNIAFNPLPLRP